jgi:hypothetical protein
MNIYMVMVVILLLWVLAQFRLVLHTVSISRAEVAMLGCTGII